MIEIKDKTKCCGCSACAMSCPTAAIKMDSDEQGFLYPKVNKKECIHCNKCDYVCPILKPKTEKPFLQRAYLLQHKDKSILMDSASGGAFSAIAETILDKDGVVFGAAYDSNFNVVHACVDNKNELNRFRNSKYVQSELQDSFKQIKNYISDGRYVLFSGTPCQVEGLLNYIGKESELLFTADVVCHAVPSPSVWREYIKSLNDDSITNLRFRDKDKYGYLYSQFKIESKKQTRFEGVEKNWMLRAFFSEICNRPSCYECSFKKKYRRSDFTMWDCFDLEEFSNSNVLDQKSGISRLIVHSPKAISMINDVLEKCIFEEISVDNALHYDAKEMFESVKKNDKYDLFWQDFYRDRQKAMGDYFRPTIGTEIEGLIRRLTYSIGIYPFIRTIYKKMFGNKKR